MKAVPFCQISHCVSMVVLLLIGIHFEISIARTQNIVHMAVPSFREFRESSPETTFAPVTFAFAKHFQNEMVLQREPQQANIYGFSPDIGQKVIMTVTSSSSSQPEYYETTVKQGTTPGVGEWFFTLKAAAAGVTVSIRVESERGLLNLSDVIFGDVWVCSGQSNMEFTVGMMDGAKEELADAINYPNVRIFAAAEVTSTTPLSDLSSVLENWSKPSNVTLGGAEWTYFSAVCWLFGKNIHKALGIPIGLVDTNWGGTPVEAWSSPDALAKCNITFDVEREPPKQQTRYSEADASLRNRGVGGPGDNSVLWNAMVNPLIGMTIYGAIWYQGEADASHPMVDHYNCTFPAMIDDWRMKFHAASGGQTVDNFPFGFVQLSANAPDPSIAFGLPDIRWHQTADYGYVPNERLNNVFMAVAMDLPGFTSPYGTIHPQDKIDVGERLALSGLHYAYNQPGICQGPYPKKATPNGDLLVVQYANPDAAEHLEIRDWAGFDFLCIPKGANTTSPAVWVPTVIVANSTDSISLYMGVCANVKQVLGLRYAWRESPCEFKKCAVYSADTGLPGAPFVCYNSTQVGEHAGGQNIFKFGGPTPIRKTN